MSCKHAYWFWPISYLQGFGVTLDNVVVPECGKCPLFAGPALTVWRVQWTSSQGPQESQPMYSWEKKLDKNCVKILNRRGLCDREPTALIGRLGADGAGPQLRVLYKLPIKKTADLQWRILHGAISVLNPAVSRQCPFCLLRETIFHVFSECKRLTELFILLTNVLICSMKPFATQCLFTVQGTRGWTKGSGPSWLFMCPGKIKWWTEQARRQPQSGAAM